MTSMHETTGDEVGTRFVDSDISLEELTQLMLVAGLPVNEYGKGEAKDIDDLQKEIAEGECFMVISPDGTLTREVKPVWVNVLCHLSDGRIMVLREEKQVFKDGRTRRRNLPSSLGEKLKAGENTDTAALRALSEEIGVKEITSIEKVSEESRSFTPPTFPGIESTYSSTFLQCSHSRIHIRSRRLHRASAQKDNYYTWAQQGRH